MTTAPLQMDPDFVFAPAQGSLLAQSRVPVMVGDFFGPVVPTGAAVLDDDSGVPGAIISTGGAPGFQTGRQKIVENTSPIPQDRIFFNYSYFDNVPLLPDGLPVNRFVPGFEKTFFDGNMSFEARFPFATTLGNTTVFETDAFGDPSSSDLLLADTNSIVFGNITLYLKALLLANETHALSAGLGISLPTANDNRVLTLDQATAPSLLEVRNESVHLLPYLGGVYTPNDRFFAQAFVQLDIDLNGNPVYASGGISPDGSQSGLGDFPARRAGTVNDQTFLYADLGIGYWIYRNEQCDACLTGIAPRLELHYNASVSNPDVVSFSRTGEIPGPAGFGFSGTVASGLGDFEMINALIGSTFEIQHDSSLTLAYVVPVGGGSDQVFDGELRVLLNYFYGPSPRRYGAPTTGFVR